MNELMIFSNSEFGEVRTVTIDNEPWFVAKDVADAIGYERADNAIRNHVDEEDKLMHQISASGQIRSMYLINESGLYALVLSSKLDSAKKFKRWVTSEVIPQVRKTGSYLPDVAKLSPELQLMNALVQQLNKQALDQKKLEGVIQETKDDLQNIRDVVEIKPFDNWRDTTNKLINKMAYAKKNYEEIKTEIYKALDSRAGTKINTRLENMKDRASRAGMSRSRVDALTNLAVIGEDKKLIEIYTAIVKEMAIKKGVTV